MGTRGSLLGDKASGAWSWPLKRQGGPQSRSGRCGKVKGKGKVVPVLNLSTTPWRRMGQRRYSSTHSLTCALDGAELSASRPGSLYSEGKSSRYRLYRRLGGPQCRSGHDGEEKNSQPLTGVEPQSSYRPARSQSLYRLIYPDSSGRCGEEVNSHPCQDWNHRSSSPVA
jgi:hypothetical protein